MKQLPAADDGGDDDDDDVDDGDSLCAYSSVSVPEVQPTVSLNNAQDMIQKLKLFALNAGNSSFLDHVVELEELTVHMRLDVFTKQSKIDTFFQKV